MAVTGSDTIATGAGNDIFRSAGGYDGFDAGADIDRLVIDYSDATTAVTQTYLGGSWYRLGDKLNTQAINYVNVENSTSRAAAALTGSAAAQAMIGWWAMTAMIISTVGPASTQSREGSAVIHGAPIIAASQAPQSIL